MHYKAKSIAVACQQGINTIVKKLFFEYHIWVVCHFGTLNFVISIETQLNVRIIDKDNYRNYTFLVAKLIIGGSVWQKIIFSNYYMRLSHRTRYLWVLPDKVNLIWKKSSQVKRIENSPRILQHNPIES